MIKELKYLFFVLSIVLFIYFIGSYYFSDKHIKKSYLIINNFDKSIKDFSKTLPVLTSDTDNMIEYSENKNKIKNKEYSFWKLLGIND